MPRPRNVRPTSVKIFHGADGRWHGYITVGVKADGQPDVRHRSASTEAECAAKIRKLEDQRAAGRVAKPGQIPTVGQLLTQWLDEEVAPDLRYATLHRSYGWAAHKHLIPGLGYHRLDALIDDPTPVGDYFRGLPATISARGKPMSQASVHAIWRTLRATANWAVAQGVIPVSFLARVKAPTLGDEEITPLFVDEVKRIFEVCEHRRNGTRWTVGLSLGFRQNEALGMPWWTPPTSTRGKPEGLDPDGGFVEARTKAERRKWQHGCKDPAACAGRRCRTRPCRPPWQHGCQDPAACYSQAWRCKRRKPGVCRTHRRPTCPAPCLPGCTGHASSCPQRTGGGIVLGEDVKSRAGRRRVALAQQMRERMLTHRARQEQERELAGDLWQDNNLVWCGPTGRPIDASADRREWKAILKEAGVRDARIHDGRHTAATLLLLMGVDGRIVLELMGWADSRMLRRYQHVIDEMRKTASQAVADHLWGPVEPTPPQPVQAAPESPNPEGSTTDHATGNVIAFRPRSTKKPPTAGRRLS